VPEESAELDDYLSDLGMVPDAQSFADGTKEVEFESDAYKIEITDPQNELLEEEDEMDDAESES